MAYCILQPDLAGQRLLEQPWNSFARFLASGRYSLHARLAPLRKAELREAGQDIWVRTHLSYGEKDEARYRDSLLGRKNVMSKDFDLLRRVLVSDSSHFRDRPVSDCLSFMFRQQIRKRHCICTRAGRSSGPIRFHNLKLILVPRHTFRYGIIHAIPIIKYAVLCANNCFVEVSHEH